VRNASAADCARELNTETATARACAPVASCTAAARNVIYARRSDGNVAMRSTLAHARLPTRHYVFTTCTLREDEGLRVAPRGADVVISSR
jgi:hypothetical protein